MLAHPEISLPDDFAEAVARKLKPHVVFHVCVAYCADLGRGAVDNAGALMYRLAHLDETRPRLLPGSQTENIRFHQDFHLHVEEIEREIDQRLHEQEVGQKQYEEEIEEEIEEEKQP